VRVFSRIKHFHNVRCSVRSAHLVRSLVVFIVAIPLAWSAGCSSNGGGPGGGNGDAGSSGGSGSGGSSGGNSFVFIDAGGQCTVGSQCRMSCGAGGTTSISGTVYDPAGNNPLPSIAVYIPETLPLPTLPKGASCDACNTLFPAHMIAGTVTKSDGTFQIVDVPVGQSVPLVVQSGKWRMQYSLTVNGCQDNQFKGMLRLPRSGGEGTLPDIAISTGGADSLECLLTRIGVDPGEYTNGAAGPGHIHIFQGGTGGGGSPGPTLSAATPISSTALWNSAANMQTNFDVVLLSCEGFETSAPNPTALQTYLNNGGRVFASHFHYAWFTTNGSPFTSYNLANWQAGTQDTGDINSVVNTAFPKGQQMHDWLKLVGALNTNDQLAIKASRQNIIGQSNSPPTSSWISSATGVSQPAMPGWTQYFSFDLNSGEKICGRMVYSDLHVGAASGDYGGAVTTTGGTVPAQCKAGKLSPQETALEYMLFDLTSCLTPPNHVLMYDGGVF
jgi:hypothetical protein